MSIFNKNDLEDQASEKLTLLGTQWSPILSYKQRMTGFMICLILGIMIQIYSFGSLLGLLTTYPNKFAMTLTLGNMVQLVGSFFLIGPAEQVRQMFAKQRVLLTLIYLGSIVATFIIVNKNFNFVVVTSIVVVQCIAYLFYVFSYFP